MNYINLVYYTFCFICILFTYATDYIYIHKIKNISYIKERMREREVKERREKRRKARNKRGRKKE